MHDHPYYLALADVIRARQRAAASYEQAAALADEIGHRLLERMDFIRLQPQVILDLGCAAGSFTRQLAKRYPQAQVIGVDVAELMLLQAKHKAASSQSYLAATLDKLPLPSPAVDLIWANLCLAWYLDINAVLQELKRILKPGGLLMFTTLGPDTLKELRQSWAHVDEAPHVHAFYDMHDIGDALLNLKFADPVLDVEQLLVTYPTVEKLLYELKACGAINVAKGRRRTLLSKQSWQKFLAAYQGCQDQDQRIPASYEIIYGHAWAPPEDKGSNADHDGNAYFSVEQLMRKRRRGH